jgi:hypothetical protein
MSGYRSWNQKWRACQKETSKQITNWRLCFCVQKMTIYVCDTRPFALKRCSSSSCLLAVPILKLHLSFLLGLYSRETVTEEESSQSSVEELMEKMERIVEKGARHPTQVRRDSLNIQQEYLSFGSHQGHQVWNMWMEWRLGRLEALVVSHLASLLALSRAYVVATGRREVIAALAIVDSYFDEYCHQICRSRTH